MKDSYLHLFVITNLNIVFSVVRKSIEKCSGSFTFTLNIEKNQFILLIKY